MNEIMLDQLPILADMHTYLEHLSMMDPPVSKQDLILEQVIENTHEGKSTMKIIYKIYQI